MNDSILHLFDATGIELEYMIVDKSSLSVLPVADRVLEKVAGGIVSEVEMGTLSWSNELVLHVIELKTNGPASSFAGLGDEFFRDVEKINGILDSMGAMLMPTACHPWMDPNTETVLWPHEYSPVYEAYDRIFGCRGHGWSNLQSTHINLPFNGDEEFGRLHAAIRFLLPIMPALTASSPVLDGNVTGFMDSRMEVYRHNSDRIPSVAGKIIPEPVYSKASYDAQIFNRMYDDIRPFDPAGVLQHEFLNSRGAIARFDRNAIEIRVLDIQENPRADVAIVALITAVIKKLCSDRTQSDIVKEVDTESLSDIFLSVIKDADTAMISDRNYLKTLGFSDDKPLSCREIWKKLAKICFDEGELHTEIKKPLQVITEKGCLARRIVGALNGDARRERLYNVYQSLCDCLAEGEMFHG